MLINLWGRYEKLSNYIFKTFDKVQLSTSFWKTLQSNFGSFALWIQELWRKLIQRNKRYGLSKLWIQKNGKSHKFESKELSTSTFKKLYSWSQNFALQIRVLTVCIFEGTLKVHIQKFHRDTLNAYELHVSNFT